MLFSIKDAGSVMYPCEKKKNELHSTSQHIQKLTPGTLEIDLSKMDPHKSFQNTQQNILTLELAKTS